MLTNTESKGQCEPGYTAKTVTLHVGDCDYIVDICYKCYASSPGAVKVNSITLVDPNCNNSVNIDFVTWMIYQEISTGAFIYSNLCPGGINEVPPCTTEYYNNPYFEVTYYYCWQKWLRFDGTNYYRMYVPCDENAECIERVYYCWDNVNQKINFVKEIKSAPQNPPCNLEWFQVPWPTTPNTKSDCFIIHNVPCGILPD